MAIDRFPLAFNIETMKIGCPLLQSGLGGSPEAAKRFPHESWTLQAVGLQIYMTTQAELQLLAKKMGVVLLSERSVSMKFVIVRDDGQFVTPAGSEHSYTKNLVKARQFDSRAEAERERCQVNERVVPYEDAGRWT